MGEKVVCTNREVGFRYEIIDRYEAGMVLVGSEVKSLRDNHAQLNDSHIMHSKGELWLLNSHIAPYAPANQFNHKPERQRKLLLNRIEIDKIIGKMKERGLTMVPTKLYFKGGKAKCEIALVKSKKKVDRREDLKKKTHMREIERAVKGRGR